MSDESGQENRTLEVKIRLRADISEGYAMVKSLALAEGLAAATPEQLMAEQLDDVAGPSTNPRKPSYIERVKNTRSRLRQAIEQIRSMSPEELAASSASDSTDSAITEESDA
ncbi:MAG: hypothetical protein KKC80_08825 [Candidatus Margulisbacteria bacterium]|nr:hypothetical protein [Candidatus Margulisiibacteriota bacterium]